MANLHIAFDNRTGRIIGVHHGETDFDLAHKLAHSQAQIPAEHFGFVAVDPASLLSSKAYRVDTIRQSLAEDVNGARFSFGKTGRTT